MIDHPGSVAILAHDDEFVYLVAQPREAVEEDALLEIPAGTLDHEGETELECAVASSPRRRELAATDWTELTKIYPSPGYISEVVTIFLATGLSPATASATRTRRSTSSACRSPRSTRRCPGSATPRR